MNNKLKEKYNRNIILDKIGEDGQQKLLDAKVLVVGAGGLGSPVLLYLVAAGIGTIGIIDHDVVSLSNLQRQVLYKESQFGESKVECAKETLQQLNPDCTITIFNEKLVSENAKRVLSDYDIVVGATDNLESRHIIDLTSKDLGIPFVHGSICEFQGQVSVFNYQNGPSYSDVFPDASPNNQVLGVMGILPGIIGSMQATEVVKIILEIGEVLAGKLLIYDALNCQSNLMELD